MGQAVSSHAHTVHICWLSQQSHYCQCEWEYKQLRSEIANGVKLLASGITPLRCLDLLSVTHALGSSATVQHRIDCSFCKIKISRDNEWHKQKYWSLWLCLIRCTMIKGYWVYLCIKMFCIIPQNRHHIVIVWLPVVAKQKPAITLTT